MADLTPEKLDALVEMLHRRVMARGNNTKRHYTISDMDTDVKSTAVITALRAQLAEAEAALTQSRTYALALEQEMRDRIAIQPDSAKMARAPEIAALIEAASSDAAQSTYAEWQAIMGKDVSDKGDMSDDWHSGYDAAILRLRAALARINAQEGK